MPFPPGLHPTPFDLDDLDELTRFVQRVSLSESGRKHFTVDELRVRFGMPGFQASRDSVVLRDSSGMAVGAAWVQTRPPQVRFDATGFVAPERLGEGIGTALLEWAMEMGRSRLGEAPAGARVTLSAGVDASHQPSVDLMEGAGLELVRYFIEMRIDFQGEMPPPRFPPEIEVRPFRPDVDLEVAHKAIDEAFRDHFGHVESSAESGVERFRHWVTSATFDPSLAWLLVDGDEVAGVSICEPSVEGEDRIGYVASLSVRRPWRGRGLAKAMLLLAFHEFRNRGKAAATLHVDAESLTGATRLYEGVGMRESDRYAAFEMELRPGEDLTVR